jgi:nucleoside-diphosphate-sugar epimerase
MRRVLVTGANGFVGRHACAAFAGAGWEVRTLVRQSSTPPSPYDERAIGDLATATLSPHFADVHCVVHLAGRAHRLADPGGDAAYHAANTTVTRRVAEAARGANVGRFVLASTAKVFGEERDRPYTPADTPAPADAYARSKLESERALASVAGPMQVVVLRPPLVYGPGGKGNVPRLLKLARLATHVPLPFGSVRNRRSILYSGNLADALVHCATSERVIGGVHLPTDAVDVSTPELLRRLALVHGRHARFIPCPPSLLRFGATALGRGAEARRLLGSLSLDGSGLRASGWTPPFSLDAALSATVTEL